MQVKFFLNTSASDEGAEPVHVATEAPFMMGTGEDGEPKAWKFEAGEVTISAEIIPASGDDEQVTITEAGTALEAGSGEVRSWVLGVLNAGYFGYILMLCHSEQCDVASSVSCKHVSACFQVC